MTPKEASRKESEHKVWRNLYPGTSKKNQFDKGYTQRWTEELFKISKIQLTIPVTYKITDYNAEEIQGLFYEQELQKTSQKTFRIEKVLKRQGDKSLVKWMGYAKSFNSWIDTKAMLNLQYNLVQIKVVLIQL